MAPYGSAIDRRLSHEECLLRELRNPRGQLRNLSIDDSLATSVGSPIFGQKVACVKATRHNIHWHSRSTF